MFRRLALFAIGVFLSLVEPASAGSMPRELATRVDAAVRNDLRTTRTPGLSLAIVLGNKIVYLKGYGYKNLAKRTPVDPQTVFRFGSVSKEFTAAALLQLQEQGKVSLQAPVSTWFPWATDARDVRLVDLLSQVSGYRDYYPLDYVDREMSRPASAAAILQRYGRLQLTAAARSRWEYSNTNYTMAGRIAEKTSGLGLGPLLQKRIFGPLGMTRTFLDEPARTVADRATGYNSFFTEPQHEEAAEAPDWLNAAGALAGTAADLARWDIALMTGAILEPRSIRTMTSERVLMPGNVHTGYGLGLASRYVDGHHIVQHDGAVIGFASANRMAFDDGAAVVVLTNSYEAPASSIAKDVLAAVSPAPNAVPVVGASGAPKAHLTAAERADIDLISRGLSALRSGAVPRSLFDDEFLAFMTRANVDRARTALAELGPVKRLTFLAAEPRGGLNVSAADVVFSHGTRTAVAYAQPNGRMAELFLAFP